LPTTAPPLDSAVERSTRSGERFIRIIPLAFITYGLAYFDRVNFGYAEARGLKDTLGITAQFSSLITASFFIGYTLFQIPGAGYAARRSAKKLVFYALILWGFLCMAQGLVHNAWLLLATRTLLGVVESVVFPAMLVFLTHWFTRREKSRANTLLILGNPITMATVSVVSGALIDYFDQHPKFGLAGWQMMFVIEGLPSIIWAGFWLFLASDRPHEARWLSPEDARAVQATLDSEQAGLSAIPNYWAAFADPRVIMLSVMYFLWSIGTYGFVFWLPKAVKVAHGGSMSTIGLLCAIPYILAAIMMVIISYFSDRTLNRRLFIWPAMILGGIAFAIAASSGLHHFWVAFVALAFAGSSVYTPCGPLWALIAETVPRNVVGESMALVNSAGAVGGFVGGYLVGMLSQTRPEPGFWFLAGCLIAAGLTTLIVPKQPSPARGFDVIQ
jgi:sugar phosphate permease